METMPLRQLRQDSGHTLIPIAQCKQGHLYRLKARGMRCGVFTLDQSIGSHKAAAFIGLISECGFRFLSYEFHFDTDPVVGTAQPLEDLGWCPIEDISRDSDELRTWLKQLSLNMEKS